MKAKKIIPQLDILVTYNISEELFSFATDTLKWIHFGLLVLKKVCFQY